MEVLSACIFEDANGLAHISRLFSNRHKVAHKAKSPDEQAQHSHEVAAAWVIIHYAAVASADLSSAAEFLHHLRFRVLARRFAKQLREKGKAELADEIEHVATFLKNASKKG